jgi:energy-coupling factor transport system permease protein
MEHATAALRLPFFLNEGNVMPHPAVLILVWVTLAIVAQALPVAGLLVLVPLLLGLAFMLDARQLTRLLRRTRWILLSLLLIYAYTTPGAGWMPELGRYSPTMEGMGEGLLQLGRLLSMLSGLAILLSLLTQAQFISGIHTLALPLRWLGLSRERIAVRLALTLEYAEPAMGETAANWRGAIREALRPPQGGGARQVELYSPPLHMVDGGCLLLCAALLYGVWR